ncbi:NAD(P)H-dependent glycerol-3-phosphate dehydrogenase [Fastidiosibacter lacustris]|uniref:NAD(P)H-dependent glycerol-3-phosphate dehydrogenase n=1 Tax=Fastidiosibacter lacustris TaxID=2056695 RepID=UPI000E34EE23|nr:NAD(P)H-dependent glycerol-3-phosphate dehydrogenase [Fastidiosibacter lacustris]
MNKQILVMGAGSWGTALALQLARVGHLVYIHSWKTEHNTKMVKDKHNNDYLPDSPFPANLLAIDNWSYIIHQCSDILIATPSLGFIDTINTLKPYLLSNQGIISATKGFCHNSYQLLDQLVAQTLRDNNFGLITGPSFAKEVAKGLPTAILAAAHDIDYAKHIQTLFNSENFRCYSSTDVTGAEIGGAVKNILAIACGISDGLGFGANARAGLITRGLNELTQLGLALGGNLETFYGLSGLGDLLLTCTDNQSRNRRFGVLIGQGKTKEQACREVQQVVEGIATTKVVHKIAQIYAVPMPIVEAIYNIIHQDMDMLTIAKRLLTRGLKEE